MMEKSKLLLEAEYADIIITLLQEPYSVSSISKLVFIAFCVEHESNISSYSNRSKDFVDCFFQNLSVKFSAHYEELSVIFHVIDILKNNSIALVRDDYIEQISSITHAPENRFLQFCERKLPNPIIEINKLSSKGLLEEVIRYV